MEHGLMLLVTSVFVVIGGYMVGPRFTVYRGREDMVLEGDPVCRLRSSVLEIRRDCAK